MRRFSFIALSLFLLSACGEERDSSPVEVLTETGSPLPTTLEIFDGTSTAPGANPHFYFLPPVAEKTPAYDGVADTSLEPGVVLCPFASWDFGGESCSAPLAEFSSDPDGFGNTVSAGSSYGIVWKTNQYPVTQGQVYRIAVSILGQVLGWVDVKAYDQQTYSSFTHTDPDGFVAISDNGNLNIQFRIEDGALEAEYCDTDNVEDCDVELFTYGEEGCLRVFENPDLGGEALGSQACVPANAATLEGEPVEGIYAVVLTLEKAEVFQGGAVPEGLQVPYFPDLETFPPGIEFDEDSEGVGVVICQVESGIGSIPEDLHPQLRPFIVYADGTTVLPEDYSFGAPECEGFGSHSGPLAAGHHEGTSSIFGRVAAGLSSAASFFLPKPLIARRLHGGLNTTVYNTRGNDTPGEGEAVSTFLLGEEEFIVELGAILNVDPQNSIAAVPATGQVGVESALTITAQNAQGLPFPFEVPVTVDVVSGTDAIVGAVTHGGDGVYTATYTPTTVGTDLLTITIDGEEMAGSPFSSTIAPRSVDAAGSTFVVSYSEAGSTTTVSVSVVDTEGDAYVYGEDFPVDVQITVTGANEATATATDPDGDGTYVATYDPLTYGDDGISVTIGGSPTGDSPKTVTTAPRPVDPAGSSATLLSTADVPSGGQVDAPTNISIVVVNDAGEAYEYGSIRPIDVLVSVAGATSVASFSATDLDGDGTYEATYTPTAVGTDIVSITIDGQAVGGSPYESTIAPRSVDASGSTFEISYSEAGSPTTVTVTVADTEGELYIYGVDFPIDVEVVVVGPNGTTVVAEDPDGDGIYVASFTPDAYGDDEITVTIQGEPTGDSPIVLTTLPRLADPSQSAATLLSTDPEVTAGNGKVDAQTDITVEVKNTAGLPYDYAADYPDDRTIDVQITISGANTVASFPATDNGDGTYVAAYTPEFAGTDQVAITIDGTAIAGSPYTSEVAPLRGDINVTIDISGPGVAPEDGLPVNLYSGPDLVGTATTNGSGVATFSDFLFGAYTVHLPKRDFDADFTTMTQNLDHQSAPSEIVFSAYSEALPEGVDVYRVRADGNGNAFQYVLNNRSWTSANNQVRDQFLLGVGGHLATIQELGENNFVAGLVGSNCPDETNEKKCKYQGWIGLSDSDSEGNFQWVTGEPLTFTNWKEGEPSGKNNEDHAEINLFGFWTDENGASSTNEGYVVEWDVVWPDTPPF